MHGGVQPLFRVPAAVSLLVVLTGIAGCAPVGLDTVRVGVAAGRGHLIAGVPFVPQTAYQCGPAALAMVLGFYGLPVSQEEITRELALASLQGTLNLELEFYARRRGFEARAFPGTLARVKAELARGRPLIVFQDLGGALIRVPHFAVLVGFDDASRQVVLHSGTTPYLVTPVAEFERTWARQRGWTLLITPAGQGDSRPDRPWTAPGQDP